MERARWWLTAGTLVLLVLLGARYTLLESELKYDIAISLAGIFLFLLLWRKANQDLSSYSAFLAVIVLHNLYLYPYSPLGIRWDHYMHFISGLAIALIADRMFLKERWSLGLRCATIFFLTLGAGALHEIVEWLGYAYLGEGDGFLYFGAGDEGEWRNSILDMIFNGAGALVSCAILRMWRKIPSPKRKESAESQNF